MDHTADGEEKGRREGEGGGVQEVTGRREVKNIEEKRFLHCVVLLY